MDDTRSTNKSAQGRLINVGWVSEALPITLRAPEQPRNDMPAHQVDSKRSVGEAKRNPRNPHNARIPSARDRNKI